MRYIASLILAAALCASAQSRDITFDNNAASVTLAGTLTMPSGTPRAAVVLATGSGAQDRDETVMGVHPFRTIADRLTDHGYAVLRFDDRGVGGSTGSSDFNTDDYASDIIAAFNVLDSIVGIDVPKGVLGHSEGSNTAMKVANRDNRCRFIITLAATAWAGDSIIMSQSRAIATALTGAWEGESTQRHLMDLVKSSLPDMMLEIALEAEIAKLYGEAATLPDIRSQIRLEAATMAGRAYRSMVKYDPAADIAAVAVPWLALQGDRDMQVLPANLSTIAELNPTATTVLLEGLNHLFQRGGSGLMTEYPTLGEPDEAALSAITTFLNDLY